jgi:hypothetical protein
VDERDAAGADTAAQVLRRAGDLERSEHRVRFGRQDHMREHAAAGEQVAQGVSHHAA